MILDVGSRQLAVFGFVLVACLFSTFMAFNCVIVSLSGLLKHFLQAYTYVLSHFTLNYQQNKPGGILKREMEKAI